MILELIAFLMVLNSAVNIELIKLKHELNVTLHALYFDALSFDLVSFGGAKIGIVLFNLYLLKTVRRRKDIFFILIFDKYFTVSN